MERQLFWKLIFKNREHSQISTVIVIIKVWVEISDSKRIEVESLASLYKIFRPKENGAFIK